MNPDKPSYEELVDEIEGAMVQGAHRQDDGWYDTMAISQWRDLGDLLVRTGRWVQQDGRTWGGGRRQFYRPLVKGK